MSKRSAVTTRQTPVRESSSSAGALRIRTETITIDTTTRLEVLDLTDRVMAIVHRQKVTEGLVSLCSLHTTATVFINEFQNALLADITTFLEASVSSDAPWRHNDARYSDCERANADSHLRAMLLGHSLTLQLCGGELALGQWQRILMAEFDGPRPRQLRVMVLGTE